LKIPYSWLKEFIDTTYPKDWFVGIYTGKIVADAGSFEAILDKLHETGFDSPDVLVVQSGEDTSEMIIL